MDRLHQELVIEILSRLPFESLLQSKSVCRSWRIYIRDRELISKHFKHMVDNDPTFILQSPCHSIHNNLYFGDLSTDPNDGNVSMIIKKLAVSPLHNFNLVSSCNGLLCLSSTTNLSYQLGVYNPFTLNYMELPNLGHRPGVIGFGFDPSTKKYKVVEISSKGTCRGFGRHIYRPAMRRAAQTASTESEVHILTVGSPAWRNLGSGPFYSMWQTSQVSVNEKLHWIVTNNIMSFDLVTEQFKEVPRPDFIRFNRRFQELMVLRGCLSTVSFDYDSKELEIWVMKEYGVKESWIKDVSIPAYVPKRLQPRIPRSYLPQKRIRVLCQLRSGGIILQYSNRAVVLYDPYCMTFQDIQVTLEGIARRFRTVVHVAGLNWIDTIVDT